MDYNPLDHTLYWKQKNKLQIHQCSGNTSTTHNKEPCWNKVSWGWIFHFSTEKHSWIQCMFTKVFCPTILSMIVKQGEQRVISIGRFISSTGSVPEWKKTLDYYKSIHRSITQYETVQELLQEATEAVSQKYTINTFDLGLYMKPLPLIWTFLDKFKKHVVKWTYWHAQ